MVLTSHSIDYITTINSFLINISDTFFGTGEVRLSTSKHALSRGPGRELPGWRERIELVACFRPIVKFMIASLTVMRACVSRVRARLDEFIWIMVRQGKSPSVMA